MTSSPDSSLAKLLPLIHHAPLAMTVTTLTGHMTQVNPRCIQLIMPMAMDKNLPPDNLLTILTAYLPSIGTAIETFTLPTGLIIDQEPYQLQFTSGADTIERQFKLTIEKNTAETLLIFFEDVTDFLVKADRMR
ncbi:hypothetical protein GCM10027578_32380 [Spirosoma luteolum]